MWWESPWARRYENWFAEKCVENVEYRKEAFQRIDELKKKIGG